MSEPYMPTPRMVSVYWVPSLIFDSCLHNNPFAVLDLGCLQYLQWMNRAFVVTTDWQSDSESQQGWMSPQAAMTPVSNFQMKRRRNCSAEWPTVNGHAFTCVKKQSSYHWHIPLPWSHALRWHPWPDTACPWYLLEWLVHYNSIIHTCQSLIHQPDLQAQGLQSWMSLSSLGRNELTDMSNGVPARSARRSSMFSRRSATPEASPDAAIQVVPSESVIDDHEPPAADSLAGFFDNDFPADFDDLAYLAPGALTAFFAIWLDSEA